MNYLKEMEALLSEEDKNFLKGIYEPTIVATGTNNAYRSITVMPDGELRCYANYGCPDEFENREDIYISSRDCGLSWKKHLRPKEEPLYHTSPDSDRQYAIIEDAKESAILVKDGDVTKKVPLPVNVFCCRPPLFLEKKHRIIIACEEDSKHSTMLISDDDGDSWKVVELEPSDRFEVVPPHKKPRWENSGCEPSVVELSDGTLLAHLRTSTDYTYASYSYDHGDTWTKPTPTPFHAVLTNPCFLKLTDGRILFFFNNTKPLPEQSPDEVFPPLSDDEAKGVWEDVFTNRDTNCIAISEDDAKTWKGFRELYMNPLRNTCDFRSSGGNQSTLDKSVHQYQAMELPFGKVLVHVGQHDNVNKILIFDPAWLYETERSENLRRGMGNLSTQVYLKSVSGNYRGFTGHCAWNRTDGVIPVPDPTGDYTEVLLMRNTNDERLYNQMQGIVWNFPAAFDGEVRVRAAIPGEGFRLSLLDFWMNPCDPTVKDDANFTFEVRKNDLPDGFSDLTVRFSTKAGNAALFCGERQLAVVPMQANAVNGLCYLHLQTLTEQGDMQGALIKSLDFKSN